MTTIIDKLRNEPAMVVATVLAFLAYFGVRLSEEQASAVSQLVTVLGPLLAGLIIRRQVTPNVTADLRAQRAYEDVQVEDHPGNPLRGQ